MSKKILDLKKETGVYYPDYEDSSPHITLYMCRFEEEKYGELLRGLSTLQIPKLTFTLSELIFLEEQNRNQIFVHFNVVEKDELQHVHEQIVAVANPLRGDLMRYKDIGRHKKGILSDEEFAFTQKYGFLYFMERYNPHITIGTIPIGDMNKMQELKEKLGVFAGEQFTIDTLFVKLKRRTVPDEKVVYESESTEIPLVSV